MIQMESKGFSSRARTLELDPKTLLHCQSLQQQASARRTWAPWRIESRIFGTSAAAVNVVA